MYDHDADPYRYGYRYIVVYRWSDFLVIYRFTSFRMLSLSRLLSLSFYRLSYIVVYRSYRWYDFCQCRRVRCISLVSMVGFLSMSSSSLCMVTIDGLIFVNVVQWQHTWCPAKLGAPGPSSNKVSFMSFNDGLILAVP
jgi:hypothetical protein